LASEAMLYMYTFRSAALEGPETPPLSGRGMGGGDPVEVSIFPYTNIPISR